MDAYMDGIRYVTRAHDHGMCDVLCIQTDRQNK